MMKNDFICRSCVNGRIVVVGKKETVQLIVDELQDMKNTLEEIAGQLLAGKMWLSKEEFSEMEKEYLALIITVVEIVNGAAYLFEKSAENRSNEKLNSSSN